MKQAYTLMEEAENTKCKHTPQNRRHKYFYRIFRLEDY